jgi:hypothetical protein
MFVITHTKQDGYFEVNSQGISHEVYQIVYYIHMDFSLALQDEYLLDKNNEKTSIEIDPQRIVGQDLCKFNKHYIQFPYKRDNKCFELPTLNKIIYHKNLSDFFPRYPNNHLGNALLVDDTPYKTCQNPPYNVIFVESYKDVDEEDNYLL